MTRRPLRGDTGSATLELVVWAPGLLLLLGLLAVAGRVTTAQGAVEQAAVDAARTASVARTPGEARAAAQATAGATLSESALHCTALTVAVDASGFAVPVGQPATVTATVTCPVRLADLALPGLPGSRTVTARASSPLDTFRERA
jgi:Flp pilus assembly protein TadG